MVENPLTNKIKLSEMKSKQEDIIYKFEILEVVESRTAINDVALVMYLMSKVGPMDFDRVKYDTVIHKLVQEGNLIELRYVIDDRVRLIYFPKKTIFSHL